MNRNHFYDFVIPLKDQEGKYAPFAKLVNIFRHKFPRSAEFQDHRNFFMNHSLFISYYALFQELWQLYIQDSDHQNK